MVAQSGFVRRYTIASSVDIDEVEVALGAVYEAASRFFPEDELARDAGNSYDRTTRQFVIDCQGDAGAVVNDAFTNALTDVLGKGAFSVE